MAAPKYQHTLQLPVEVEELWITYQAQHGDETFNGFVVSILRQALEGLCATAAPTSTIR